MTKIRGQYPYNVENLRAKIAQSLNLKSVSLAFISKILRAHNIPGSVAGLREWKKGIPPTPRVSEKLSTFEEALDAGKVRFDAHRPRGRPSKADLLMHPKRKLINLPTLPRHDVEATTNLLKELN